MWLHTQHVLIWLVSSDMTKFLTTALYNEIKETLPKNHNLQPNDHPRPLRKTKQKKSNTSNSVLLRNKWHRIQHTDTTLQIIPSLRTKFPQSGHPYSTSLLPHNSRLSPSQTGRNICKRNSVIK
jgi:hypothetical protein